MPYRVPEFNLLCDVYDGPFPTKALRIHNLPCNLSLGKRVYQNSTYAGFPDFVGGASQTLLVSKGTDLRAAMCGVPSDLIELPPGSGVWYDVVDVSDVGKGFDNEFRVAPLGKLFAGRVNEDWGCTVYWPIPIP